MLGISSRGSRSSDRPFKLGGSGQRSTDELVGISSRGSRSGSDRPFKLGVTGQRSTDSLVGDKRSAAGSDDSRRPWRDTSTSFKTEQLDRSSVREHMDRCAFATVDVLRLGSKGRDTFVLGQGGLVVTGKQEPLTPPSGGPGWAYKHSLRINAIDSIPAASGVIIHPGDQRFFARNAVPSNDQYRLVLDLLQSGNRDRVVLHNDMRIAVANTKTGVEKHLRFLIPLGGASEPNHSWYRTITHESLWHARQVLSSSSSRQSGEHATASTGSATTASSKSSSKQRKSVSWGMSVDVADGTVSTLNSGDDDEVVTVMSSEDGPPLALALLQRSNAEILLDDKVILKLEDGDPRRLILVAKRCPDNLDTAQWMFVQADWIDDDNFALAINAEIGGFQLLLPRYHAKPSKTRVMMILPPTVVFPITADDVLCFQRDKTQDVLSLQLKIPKLSRSIPTSDHKDKEKLNPAYYLRHLALEVSYSPSSHDKLKSTAMPPTAFVYNKKFFSNNGSVKIGRQEGDIIVLDPHLSRTHAVVKREKNVYFVQPASENKSIFLLCGKSDSHFRPPTPLRSGDIIACGKSEFKVVFQQRGNREIQSGSTGEEELRARLTFRMENRLKVKNEKQAQGMEEYFPDESDAETDAVRSQFKNLNPMTEGESLGGSTTSNVIFRDLNSLLQHFDVSDFGNGPIMILLSVRGPKAKQFFLCNPLETIIGSSPKANISIGNDMRMSPYHCRVYFDPAMQRWMLEDLQSVHGSFVKVDEPTLASSGDVFVMGTTLMRILGLQSPGHQMHSQSSGRCINQ